MTSSVDPHNINSRLQNLVSGLLTRLENDQTLTTRDMIAALICVGRIQTMFVGLRKERRDEPAAGSAVRKYTKAFAADAARGRKKGGRSAPAPVDFSDYDDAEDELSGRA